MADIAGLALAIVSLVDSCVTASRLFSTAKDFSTESETLRLGLLREEGRLKTWARSWGIPTEGNLSVPQMLQESDATKLLMEEAENASIDLSQVRCTLSNMWELLSMGKVMRDRHDAKAASKVISFILFESIADSICSKDSNFIKEFLKTQLATLSSRVRWVVIDKDRLRTLIADLKDHNDGLDRLRPRREMSSLRSREAAVTCEVIVSADNLVLGLPEDAYEQYPQLRQILSMRQRQVDTEADNRQWIRYKSLEIEQWEYKLFLIAGTSDRKRQLAYYAARRDQATVKVMTEWKYYTSNDAAGKNLAMCRVERVAQLLSAASKPPELRILDCVGYIQDDSNSRCGLLYEVPFGLEGGSGHNEKCPQVVSLHNVLRSKARPTLAERFRLARNLAGSMLEFHLANWLHKNFNAENVTFFVSAESTAQDVDFDAPYIGSFGLSRPDGKYIDSEIISDNSINFAYVHPEYHYPTNIQNQNRNGALVPRFHRAFDVYSLGCVLLEIGLWKPLVSIGWNDKYQTDLTGWSHLLQKCTRKNLAFIAGPIYTDVVLNCLESKVDTADIRKESERVRDFCWEIMQKLDNLRV
ncbi:prion-inhibition and propagation-domain-containing protein [Crassisporium funariophilum]|nr:prion-inhibition and propagation-domain-containing protein [Crassisporium funariophilum]